MAELRAKFIGGPRDKKTRSLKGQAPAVITCKDDCKFHKVEGFYRRRGENTGNKALYDWVEQSPLQSIAGEQQ